MKLFKYIVIPDFCYIFAFMERRICPICSQMMLRPLPAESKRLGEKVLHENENYKHVTRNGQHFLIKTAHNVLEEMEMHSTLVLN